MGFWGQMWMGKEDKARKIFEEQFGEPCPRAGGDGKNCILRWPQKKPFIYIKLVDCLEKCLIYGHIRRFAN